MSEEDKVWDDWDMELPQGFCFTPTSEEENQNRSDVTNIPESHTAGSSSSVGRLNAPREVLPSPSGSFDSSCRVGPNEKIKKWFPQSQRSSESVKSGSRISQLDDILAQEFWEDDLSDDLLTEFLTQGRFEEEIAAAREKGPPQVKGSISEPVFKRPTQPVAHSLSEHAIRNVTQSGAGSSIPSSQESLTQSTSQTTFKFSKPGSSQGNSQALTTEWLRNQLDKLTKEYNSLKETAMTKEGESKILRTKLHEAQKAIEKQKFEAEIERLNLKSELEYKIKSLEKELDHAKTQALFKAKEAESTMVRYKELKSLAEAVVEKEEALSSAKKSKTSFSLSTSSLQKPSTTADQEVTQKESALTTDIASSGDFETSLMDLNIKRQLHLGNELKAVIEPWIFQEAQADLSYIIPPPMDYNPFNILYRDLSEIPLTDDSNTIANLNQIWGIPVKSENANESSVKPKKRTLHFTPLSKVNASITELCNLSRWENPRIIHGLIDHITEMAKELKAAILDVGVTTESRKKKEIIIRNLDADELKGEMNFFSPTKWREEIYVDLRRGLALLALMSQLDSKIGEIILQKSGYIYDGEFKKKYGTGCKFPQATGDWYDEEVLLTEELFMALQAFGPTRDPKDFHLEETYGVGDPLMGALKILSGKLSGDQLRFWQQRLKQLPKKSTCKSVIDYQMNYQKFEETVEKHLQVMKSNYEPSSAIVGEPTLTMLDDEKLLSEASNLPPPDSKRSFIDTKVNETWEMIVNSDMASRQITHTPPKQSEEETSLLDAIMKKEELNWGSLASQQLPSDETISKIKLLSSNACMTSTELNYARDGFHNLLKIKNAVFGEKNLCICEATENKDEHGLYLYQKGKSPKKKSKKRKHSLDFSITPSSSSTSSSSTSSSSRYSEYGVFSRRHDLAPLKKKRQEIMKSKEEDDKEIEAEVEKLFELSLTRERAGAKKAEGQLVIKTQGNYSSNKNNEQGLPERMETNTESSSDEDKDGSPTEESSEATRTFKKIHQKYRTQLFSILFDIVKNSALMVRKVPFNFNLLYVGVVRLVQSCLNSDIPAAFLRKELIVQLILEVLYCRPSIIVLRYINQFLLQSSQIQGFPKLMCHSIHSKSMILLDDGNVYFTRGACLMSFICNYVQHSCPNDEWEIEFLLFRWLAYMFFVDKVTVTKTYSSQKTTFGYCTCPQAINNAIMSIVSSSAEYYYAATLERRLTALERYYIMEIIEHGIRILSVIIDLDKKFVENSVNQYARFVAFLELITYMNSKKETFKIDLNESDLKTILSLFDDDHTERRVQSRELIGDPTLGSTAQLFSGVGGDWVEEMFFPEKSSGVRKMFLEDDEES